MIAGRSVTITGASGGIGQALIDAFLGAGVEKIYAVSRQAVRSGDRRLAAMPVDITDAAAVDALAAQIADKTDILVNNAGANAHAGLLSAASLDGARREMEVNYFGTLNMVRAFAPAMRRRRAGVIVNMLSMVSHMNRPASGSYSASKAAALSLTQGIRAELAGSGVRVCGIFPGAVDTPMSSPFSGPKTSPAEVAREVQSALADGSEDRYVGARSIELYETYLTGLSALERRLRGG